MHLILLPSLLWEYDLISVYLTDVPVIVIDDHYFLEGAGQHKKI